MRIIFCADPIDNRSVDYDYASEAAAASSIGIAYNLINFEALVDRDDPEKAVSKVPPKNREAESDEIALYRGWMLTPAKYGQLYSALESRGVRLVNTPEQYRHTHYLPESYRAIEPYTPHTIWLSAEHDLSISTIMQALTVFGDAPIVVKDYVKSRKHEWAEAFFIPSASNRAEVKRVAGNFLTRQGADLQGGLVFREYVELASLGKHPKSNMPISQEYRVFYLNGEPLRWYPYWEEGIYNEDEPPLSAFFGAAANVQSRFFTMDLAKDKNGKWLIVELGDAQVAELPGRDNAHDFYRALHDRLHQL